MSSIWVEWHSALSTCFPLRTEESIRLEDAIVSLTNWFFFSFSFLRTPSWAENEGTFQANYTIWHHKKKTPIKLFTLYRAITFTHCSFIARSFTHTHTSASVDERRTPTHRAVGQLHLLLYLFLTPSVFHYFPPVKFIRRTAIYAWHAGSEPS